MTTIFPAPAARQTAVVAAIAALHVGLFILASVGTRFRVDLLPAWVGPIQPLPAARAPSTQSPPDPIGAADYEPETVEAPALEFTATDDLPPTGVGAAEPGTPDAGRGRGLPAAEFRGPAMTTRDARLQALIDACYPSAARRLGLEGRGVARVVVGADGRASGWRVEQSTGFAQLDPGMACVARRVQFEPARRDGRAVEATILMPIAFRLD